MVNKSSLVKRRRTKAEMVQLREALAEIVRVNQPVSCRGVFYLAVSAGLVEKTETAYKNTVIRLLTDMRRSGQIPYYWITDNSRTWHKLPSYNSIEDALIETARLYRRNIWPSLRVRVEVWSEKETLTGILTDVTYPYDVRLMPTRGYPSLSYLHAAAQEIKYNGVPTYIYYFGDYDPSGLDISQKVEYGLRELAPDAEIYFQRVAVQEWQIQAYSLPTRPTKKTDSRSKAFKGESVEVDAIPPAVLRGFCREAIERHIPVGVLDEYRIIEEAEREQIRMFAYGD